MVRSFLIAQLALVLVACPTPSSNQSQGPTASNQPMVSPPTGSAQSPADVTSTDMVAPPGAPGVPADAMQRSIGALSEQGQAIKREIVDYLKEKTVGSGGLLPVADAKGETVALRWVRTHDPVRHRPGKGYLAIADFQDPNGNAKAFYSVAFWLKQKGTGYNISEVVMLAHPEKRGGEWVRMEHFTVNDEFAAPLK